MKIANSLKFILITCMFTLSSLIPVNAQGKRVYINGQLMHPNVVAQVQQAIGTTLSSGEYSWDGSYLYDGYGNSAPLTMQGTRPSNGRSWSSQSITGPSTVYDSSGGCEGGSCVNILW